MESLYSFPVAGAGGRFDTPQNPLVIPDSRYQDDSDRSHLDHLDDRDMDYLDQKFSSMSDPEGRSFGSSSLASYRSDTLSDIKFGLSKVGTVIKIASAILTLFGASDENVDR